MLALKDKVAPYNSKGKRISKSTHHPDLWIIDIIGTNKFYSINMSTQLMLQNNPPDAEKKSQKRFSINENPSLNTGRMQSIKTNRSQMPQGLAKTL